MEVKKEIKNNQLLVSVKGQIDTATCGGFEKELLGQNLGIDIVCNFKDVTYVSSAGLRVILAVHKDQISKSKKFILTNVNDDVFQVLELTGFTSFLDIQK